MEWIYKKFYGIQVCLISIEGKIQEVVSNINSERKRIIRYFGRRAEQIYGLKEVYD